LVLVLDLDGRRMVVHRGPRAGGYAERDERSAGERVDATSVVLPELDLGELLQAIAG
jgi:hypothetical protein